MLPALAGVVVVGDRDPLVDKIVLGRLRQRIEFLSRRLRLRPQRDAERCQLVGDFLVVSEGFAFEAHIDGRAVDARLEIKEILGVGVGDGNVSIRPVPDDVGQGKGDGDRVVVLPMVEELVAHHNLALGDRKVLGAQLDVVVLGQHEAAGRQLGGTVIGQRRRRQRHADEYAEEKPHKVLAKTPSSIFRMRGRRRGVSSIVA